MSNIEDWCDFCGYYGGVWIITAASLTSSVRAICTECDIKRVNKDMYNEGPGVEDIFYETNLQRRWPDEVY